MGKWDTLADKTTVEKVILSLKSNGIEVFYAETSTDAKNKFFEILPLGAEVMNNSSTTLNVMGISDEIVKSGKYNSVRSQLMKMDRKTQNREMQKMGAAPTWAVGSVHAITENGEIIIASASGSQLPGYAAGADHVIWVAGTQKIVKNLDNGFKRLHEYTFPLENERAKKAYGAGSSINKLLIVYKDPTPKRINLILVNENLGF